LIFFTTKALRTRRNTEKRSENPGSYVVKKSVKILINPSHRCSLVKAKCFSTFCYSMTAIQTTKQLNNSTNKHIPYLWHNDCQVGAFIINPKLSFYESKNYNDGCGCSLDSLCFGSCQSTVFRRESHSWYQCGRQSHQHALQGSGSFRNRDL